MSDQIQDKVLEDILRIEKDIFESNRIRNDIIEKLHKSIQNMELNLDKEPPKRLNAKIDAINSLNNIISSKHMDGTSTIKLKLRHKADEDTENISKVMIEVFKNISLKNNPESIIDIVESSLKNVKEISDVIKDIGIEVSDDEITPLDSTIKDTKEIEKEIFESYEKEKGDNDDDR